MTSTPKSIRKRLAYHRAYSRDLRALWKRVGMSAKERIPISGNSVQGEPETGVSIRPIKHPDFHPILKPHV